MPTTTVIVTATIIGQQPSFSCYPDPLTVTDPDTTIAFEFGADSTPGFQFVGLTAVHAVTGTPVYSLSAPTLYNNAQRMTIDDIDNQDEDVKYTLNFVNNSGLPYTYDPQIRNRPRPTA